MNSTGHGDSAKGRTPPIAVILPTYNGAAYVKQAIDSILAQDHADFELVICDDCSTDATRSILHEYRDPRVRVLSNSANRGLFPTLNRLMGEARSPWVHLFSQDDRMLPSCVRRTLAFAEAHAQVGMIYSQMRFIDALGNESPQPFHDDKTPAIVSPQLAARIMFYFGSIAGNIANVTLRKSAFDATGNFREDLAVSGDYDYWARLSERYPIGFQRERLIELRVHEDQFSRQWSSGLKFITENEDIYERLMSRLPQGDNERANHFRSWVIDVNAFHHGVRSLAKGKFVTAFRVMQVLRARTALTPLAMRWIRSRNGRRIKRPEIVDLSS